MSRTYTFDGPELHQRRIQAGLSVTDLAAAVDRSVASIRHYENGLSQPGIGVLLRLASVLKCSPGRFFVRAAEVEEQELVRT